jgi:DNA-binding CsgD family transcriptional regulator
VANRTINYLSGDAAFAVDRRGVIVSWNLEAEKLFNRDAGAVLGQRCWKVMAGQDLYGNRYCCKRCPLMQMASDHESVHSFPVLFRTAANGWKKFSLHCLTVFGGNRDELLLHICNSVDEIPENVGMEYSDNKYPDNNHVKVRPSANNHRGALTNREHEVLALLVEGKSTRDIASLMCISPATVRNHIQHTMYKLHVHTRLEAVVTAHHLDLV